MSGRVHWACSRCTFATKAPRHRGGHSTRYCTKHKCAVVPAGYLWAATKFSADRALAIPAAALKNYADFDLPKLKQDDVVVSAKGPRGYVCRVDSKILAALKIPAVASITFTTNIDGQLHERTKNAVFWPSSAEQGVGSWLAPRNVHDETGIMHDNVVAVQKADWFPAPASDDHVFGVSRSLLKAVMMSSCARSRWWFVMPHTTPPISVPAESRCIELAQSRGTTLDFGTASYAPYVTYPWASVTPQKEGEPVTCAWCRAQFPNTDYYYQACVPEISSLPFCVNK